MNSFKPTNLFWLVSTSCNERCTKCHHWTQPAQRDLLDPDDLVALARHIDSLQEICVTGGEPLLHRRALLRVINSIADQGVRTVIVTNGRLLDSEFLDQIRGAHIHIVVSIDTVDREHWSFVRGRDSYDQVMGNLRLAAKALPVGGLSIQSVLAKETEGHLAGVRALCDQLGVYHSIQDYMNDGFDGEWTALPPSETWVGEDQRCQAGGRSLSVMPDGTVYSCFQQSWIPGCERPLGRLGQDSADVILNSDYARTVLRRMHECRLPCRVLKCNQDNE